MGLGAPPPGASSRPRTSGASPRARPAGRLRPGGRPFAISGRILIRVRGRPSRKNASLTSHQRSRRAGGQSRGGKDTRRGGCNYLEVRNLVHGLGRAARAGYRAAVSFFHSEGDTMNYLHIAMPYYKQHLLKVAHGSTPPGSNKQGSECTPVFHLSHHVALAHVARTQQHRWIRRISSLRPRVLDSTRGHRFLVS